MAPYTWAPSSCRKCLNSSGSGGMSGGPFVASCSSASLSRSLRAPSAITTCHGWMLELDGAHCASSRASSSTARGTGWDRNLRVECRALIVCSRSAPILRLQHHLQAALVFTAQDCRVASHMDTKGMQRTNKSWDGPGEGSSSGRICFGWCRGRKLARKLRKNQFFTHVTCVKMCWNLC